MVAADGKDVVGRKKGIGRVRKGRIEILSIPPDSSMQGSHEFRVAPLADPCFPVRRDVGRIDRSKRKFEGAPARKRLAPGSGVAGGAIGRFGQIPPFRDECGSSWLRVRSLDRFDRGGPKEQACGRERDGDTESAYSDEDSLHAFSRLESRLRSIARLRMRTPVRAEIAFPGAGSATT